MKQSHLAQLVLFAAFVSVVFAALMRPEPREQGRLALRLFAAFVLGAYAIGWILYFIPR